MLLLPQPNLVKLYHQGGEVWIDTNQLNSPKRVLLTMYTSNGQRLKDVASDEKTRLQAEYGVHRDNLFASMDLADAESDRIYKEIFGPTALTSQQWRNRQVNLGM